jgi:hypothetical protein
MNKIDQKEIFQTPLRLPKNRFKNLHHHLEVVVVGQQNLIVVE